MPSIKTIDNVQSNKFFLAYIQVMLVLGLNFLPGLSHAFDFCDLQPYAGLEYVHRTLAFQEGYGKGDFSKCLPQANILVGMQLNDYLGLEAGYLFSTSPRRTSLAIGGSGSFGKMVPPGGYIVLKSKIHLNGPQINVLGTVPLGSSPFSLIGSLGISSLILKANYKPIADEVAVLSPLEVIESKRSFCMRKWVPKLMGGFGYQFTHCIGIRALMGYEGTKQFKNLRPREASRLRVSLKNNVLGSIGFIARF